MQSFFARLSILLISSFLFMGALAGQNERPEPRKNVIKLDFFPIFAVNSYGIDYERMISPSIGLNNFIAYTQTSVSLDTASAFARGGMASLELRGYLNEWRWVPEGYYFSFFLKSKYFLVEGDIDEVGFDQAKLFTVGLGLNMGHQWLMFDNRFAIDITGGAGFFLRQTDINEVTDALGETGASNISNTAFQLLIDDGFTFRLALGFGYAF